MICDRHIARCLHWDQGKITGERENNIWVQFQQSSSASLVEKRTEMKDVFSEIIGSGRQFRATQLWPIQISPIKQVPRKSSFPLRFPPKPTHSGQSDTRGALPGQWPGYWNLVSRSAHKNDYKLQPGNLGACPPVRAASRR